MGSVATGNRFKFEVTDHALGRNLPQRVGNAAWLPMLVMGLVAFPAGVALSIVAAAERADGGPSTTISALAHFTPGVMFLGFTAVFSAISFAIARILGELRTGGGAVQEAAGRKVETLKMPVTAKVFLAGMAMAMMTLVAAVVLHFIIGTAIAGDSAYALAHSGQWAIWLEGVRRFAVALYLLAIGFGLATIVTVLRFQVQRIRELPEEPRI